MGSVQNLRRLLSTLPAGTMFFTEDVRDLELTGDVPAGRAEQLHRHLMGRVPANPGILPTLPTGEPKGYPHGTSNVEIHGDHDFFR